MDNLQQRTIPHRATTIVTPNAEKNLLPSFSSVFGSEGLKTSRNRVMLESEQRGNNVTEHPALTRHVSTPSLTNHGGIRYDTMPLLRRSYSQTGCSMSSMTSSLKTATARGKNNGENTASSHRKYPKYYCKEIGCTKWMRRGGFCFKHGGGTRCDVEGCNRSAQTGRLGKCMQHSDTVTRCKFKGCYRIVWKNPSANGHCKTCALA